ncbi:MAG: nucleotidyltransferase family protein [Dermatophilaceae bacterium]
MRSEPTPQTLRLRAALDRQQSGVGTVLDRFGATNPRLFGSVARGDARDDSDLDLLVDLIPGAGNELMRVAGLAEELSELLGVRVDVVAATLLRDEVSATALEDAVAVSAARTHSAWTISGRRSRAASHIATGEKTSLTDDHRRVSRTSRDLSGWRGWKSSSSRVAT